MVSQPCLAASHVEVNLQHLQFWKWNECVYKWGWPKHWISLLYYSVVMNIFQRPFNDFLFLDMIGPWCYTWCRGSEVVRDSSARGLWWSMCARTHLRCKPAVGEPVWIENCSCGRRCWEFWHFRISCGRSVAWGWFFCGNGSLHRSICKKRTMAPVKFLVEIDWGPNTPFSLRSLNHIWNCWVLLTAWASNFRIILE